MAGRLSLFALVCLAAGAMGSWASMAAPPQPPVGWEERVLPGFEPSLESVLARGGYFADDYAREAWKNWGPDAVEGFFKLLNDASWEKFRASILRMLFLSPHAEARARLEQEVRAAASVESASKSGDIHSFMGLFSRYFPQTSLPLFKELAQSPREDVRTAVGNALVWLGTDESLALANEVAASLSGSSRSSVEWSIEAAMGAKRSREIMIK